MCPRNNKRLQASYSTRQWANYCPILRANKTSEVWLYFKTPITKTLFLFSWERKQKISDSKSYIAYNGNPIYSTYFDTFWVLSLIKTLSSSSNLDFKMLQTFSLARLYLPDMGAWYSNFSKWTFPCYFSKLDYTKFGNRNFFYFVPNYYTYPINICVSLFFSVATSRTLILVEIVEVSHLKIYIIFLVMHFENA